MSLIFFRKEGQPLAFLIRVNNYKDNSQQVQIQHELSSNWKPRITFKMKKKKSQPTYSGQDAKSYLGTPNGDGKSAFIIIILEQTSSASISKLLLKFPFFGHMGLLPRC